MITRHLGKRLEKAAAGFPVVAVTGPRQSGKTTLVKATFRHLPHVNLERPDLRALARGDPLGFLARYPDGAILDEVQRVPELFSYVHDAVDNDPRPGRFVLTGSQNFALLDAVSDSLAGRVSVNHLLPLSFDEIVGRPSALPEQTCARNAVEKPGVGDVFSTLFTGFFPRIRDRSLDPQEWLASYYETYLERDVRAVANVGDLATFSRFVSLCAGRSGQVLNHSALALDAGVSHTTARRWLSVLEASFQVALVPPFHRNFNKRLIKSPKLHFLDSGLLCYLLRIRSPEELFSHSARGAVFESFVVGELLKRYHNSGQRPGLFFWRDQSGHEVDLILDFGARVLALEVKSAQTFHPDFLRDLTYLANLAGPEDVRTAAVYAGDEAARHRGARIVPWWGL